MAIRMRRGNEADFDPEKMLPGEWAVSTDTKYVRMCFAPGIVLRMATYEAFESDMAEIRNILSECQSIQTAVELIQKNVTDSELVIENYAKEAKQYRDEAEQYRNETEQFRNEAFSTTSGLIINNTASGDNIHLMDSAKSKVLAFGLYGKAVQKQYTGKNLIPYPYYQSSGLSNGIEFVNNGDGSVTANGVASAHTSFIFNHRIDNSLILSAGTYKISGCPSGGSDSTYRLVVGRTSETTGSFEVVVKEYGDGATFTLTKETDIYIGFEVITGATLSNVVCRPMLRLASITDDTYEPYVGGKPAPNPDYPQEITISKGKYDSVAVTLESGDRTESCGFALRTDGLAGIPVDSCGNYTDENGQQWICDEIVKYADGSGKRIQRIYKHKVTSAVSYNSPRAIIELPIDMMMYDSSNNVLSACNRFKAVKHTGIVTNIDNSCGGQQKTYAFHSDSLGFTTKEEWTAWFKANETIIYYVLAEPIETDLTADELKVYENLQTFYPATNISNNANCGMSITYVADTKNYIDSKIASLEKALYNNI